MTLHWSSLYSIDSYRHCYGDHKKTKKLWQLYILSPHVHLLSIIYRHQIIYNKADFTLSLMKSQVHVIHQSMLIVQQFNANLWWNPLHYRTIIFIIHK
jgi:hypothetical protein